MLITSLVITVALLLADVARGRPPGGLHRHVLQAHRNQHRRHPHLWRAPRWWLPEAMCIHHYEGAWNANTGNGYYGGMQFLLSTWQSVGGRGYPHLASPREQLFRAWLVYRRDGNSFREWGTASLCGLH